MENKLKELIYKIYNEGLFLIENNEKNQFLLELERETEYKAVSDLFLSDLGPRYVFNTINLYNDINNKIKDKEFIFTIINSLINQLDSLEEYEVDVYFYLLEEEFKIDSADIFDRILELSSQGLSVEEIYTEVKKETIS